ncbi:MAG TPA: FAD-dependent oxidoreductase [Candidatus Eisenbacteria bacterium]|jgi:protoporphyrinogen oxidase
MPLPSVLVLGGGLSGMAAAYSLARAGVPKVVLVERGAELGGLAGTFERHGHFYPLGYHHILHRDRTLLYFLDLIGALPRVRWRKIRMLFRLGGRQYDLADPLDFLRFPMGLPDKLRFVRLMVRSFGKSNWSDWSGHSAGELVERWAGSRVRETLFEPLARLKFQLPLDQVSAAWLGTRLHFREGSAALGYIPQHNWTKVLCDGLTRLLLDQGVEVRTRTTVRGLHHAAGRLDEVELADGERLQAECVVSAIPTELYTAMVPVDATPELDKIRYTALISLIGVSKQRVEPDFYWMNLASLDHHACGIFMLNSLNPTIGGPGEVCINFVTHLAGRHHEGFRRSDQELLAAYRQDFRAVFGFEFEPLWTHVARVPMYSPVFLRDYRNPPIRSLTLRNVYFAGNYRTFPSAATTGTAMWSGLEAAEAILRDGGRSSPMIPAVTSFRLRSMPRP